MLIILQFYDAGAHTKLLGRIGGREAMYPNGFHFQTSIQYDLGSLSTWGGCLLRMHSLIVAPQQPPNDDRLTSHEVQNADQTSLPVAIIPTMVVQKLTSRVRVPTCCYYPLHGPS